MKLKYFYSRDIEIDFDKVAEDQGFDTFEELLVDCIEGDNGSTYLQNYYKLYKKWEEVCANTPDDKEVTDEDYDKYIKEGSKQLAKFIVEVLEAALES